MLELRSIIFFFMVYSFFHNATRSSLIDGPFRWPAPSSRLNELRKKRAAQAESFLDAHQSSSNDSGQRKTTNFVNDKKLNGPFAEIKTLCWCFHFFGIIWNSWIIIKYSILVIIELEAFLEYRYMSCLLLGRVMITERTVEFSKYFTIFCSSVSLIWQIYSLLMDPIYLECLDFLVHESHADILVDECLELEESQQRFVCQWWTHRESQTNFDCNSHWCGRRVLLNRRANRSSEAWLYLAQRAKRYAAVLAKFVGLNGILLGLVQLPQMFKSRGFILNYGQCVSYIRDNYSLVHTGQLGGIYSMIHQSIATEWRPLNSSSPKRALNQTEAFEMFIGFNEIMRLNLYQVVRILFEIIENLLVIGQIMVSIVSPVFVLLLVTDDLIYYSNCVSKRIQAFIPRHLSCSKRDQDLKERHPSPPESNIKLDECERERAQHWWLSIAANRSGCDGGGFSLVGGQFEAMEARLATNEEASLENKQLHHVIVNRRLEAKLIQLNMADLFYLTRLYNLVASKFVRIYLYVWFSYTAFATGWMFTPGDFLSTSKLECYIIHAYATLLSAFIIGRFAMVRTNALLHYKQMVGCMAYEKCPMTKSSWSKLLYFFHPKPMHCFTVFNSVEISLFFGMKLLAWMLSVLLALSTFYYR